MNFLLRKLFQNIPPEQEGEVLVKRISGSAYQVFLDQQFRKMVDFEKQSQVEKDRIFNELVVTGVILLLSIIKDCLSKIKEERQEFWQTVYEKVPDIFVDWLSELGVQKKYANIWRKLIDLRFDEYQEKQTWTREAWMQDLIKHQDKEILNDAAVRIETLIISSMLHVTRGKAKKNDPLKKHLGAWLMVLNNKLMKRVGW